MLTPREFLAALSGAGYTDIVGVPCSTMSGVYEELATDPRFAYHAAPNEGAALAAACGLLLAGRQALVLVQNSGFGNLVNPLTSFAMPYRVPVVVVMTMRGWPSADSGEPQHKVMGGRAEALIQTMGLPCHWLPADPQDLGNTLAAVQADGASGSPVFVLAAPGTVAAAPARAAVPGSPGDGTPTRAVAVRFLLKTFPEALFVSTVGNISRELFAAADRPQNLYVQGAMGHAVSVATGVAIARPDRRVVAVDGDGSAIMHLGAMSFVGGLAPSNLLHVILDNGVYDSTGGQPTTAPSTGFARVAAACGYRRTFSVRTEAALRRRRAAFAELGPVLAHVAVSASSPSPGGRASESIGPAEVAARFAAEATEGARR